MKKLILMLTILVAGMVQAQEFNFECPTDVEYDYTVGIAKSPDYGTTFEYVSSIEELGDNLAWFRATANGDTPGFMVDGFQRNGNQHWIDNPIDLSNGAFYTEQNIRISAALHNPPGTVSEYIYLEYTLTFDDTASTTVTGTIRFE